MISQPIQIVSGNDIPIGEASMDEAQKTGLFHRIVRIMVEDNRGRVLLQKRQATMGLYPNCWDNSAAGHVDANESYEIAAKRELSEEIGLKHVDLVEMGYYKTQGNYNHRQLNRFNKAYKVVVPDDTKFTIQKEEVSEVRWFSVNSVKKLMAKNPDKVTNGLIEIFKRFY